LLTLRRTIINTASGTHLPPQPLLLLLQNGKYDQFDANV